MIDIKTRTLYSARAPQAIYGRTTHPARQHIHVPGDELLRVGRVRRRIDTMQSQLITLARVLNIQLPTLTSPTAKTQAQQIEQRWAEMWQALEVLGSQETVDAYELHDANK